MGGDVDSETFQRLFPAETWLISPTDDMAAYPVPTDQPTRRGHLGLPDVPASPGTGADSVRVLPQDAVDRGRDGTLPSLPESRVTSIDPRITELERELRDAKRQIVHWRKNSEEQVRRKHVVTGIKDEIIAEQEREIAALRDRLRGFRELLRRAIVDFIEPMGISHLTHGTQWREAADEFLRECAPLVFSKDETVFGVKPRVKP